MKKMKKIVLLALLFAFSLSAIAQKRVAVYVDGNDPEVINYVAGEMVKVISQSRNYKAVNRSDDFSKQLQSERAYSQSGMVDDRQIARLGKENGVNFVCAVRVKHYSNPSEFYSIEARLIDVNTADIVASDQKDVRNYYRSEKFEAISKVVNSIGNKIVNFEARSHNSGYLVYSDKNKDSKVALNAYGDERPLSEMGVRSLLVSNPEAFDLYEKGLEKAKYYGDAEGWAIFLGALGTVCFGTWAVINLVEDYNYNNADPDDRDPNDKVDPMAKKWSCVLAVGSASLMTFGIVRPGIVRKNGEKKIRKALGLYNRSQTMADNLELSFGFGMNSVGLTLSF